MARQYNQLMNQVLENRFARPKEKEYPLSTATKLKVSGPGMLGTFRIKIKFKTNGKTENVDLGVASEVENSDLIEQPRNLDRLILELRRKTKLY